MTANSPKTIDVAYDQLVLYLKEWVGLEFSTVWLGHAPKRLLLANAEHEALNVVEQMMVQHGTIHPRMTFSGNDYSAIRDLGATLVSCSIIDGRCVWWVWESRSKGAPVLHRVGPIQDKTVIKNEALFQAKIGDTSQLRQWVPISTNLPLEALRMRAGAPKGKARQTLLRVWHLLMLERSALWTLFVYAIFVGLMTLLMPLTTQIIISSLAFTSVLQPLLVLTLAILLGLAFAGVLKVFEFVVVEFIQRRIFFYTVQDTTTRLLRLDRTAIQNRHVPELVNRFFDIVTVQKAASSLLLDGLSLLLQTSIGLIVLAFYHPVLLAFDVVLILCMGLILFVLGRGAIKTSIGESNAKYKVAAWLEDIANAPHGLKSDQNMARAMNRTNSLAGEYLNQRQTHFQIVLRQIIGAVILQIIANAALIGLGGWLVLKGQLTLGQLVAAEIIVTMIVVGVVKFGKHFESFYDLCASVYKLGELIDLPLERHGTKIPKTAEEPTLDIQNVVIHPKTRPLSHRIESGQHVALVDTDAQTASLLLRALFGFKTMQSGEICYNEVALNQWSLPRLRRHIVLIEEIEIFGVPLHANVFWTQKGVDEALEQDIMDTLSLERLAKQLPDGWDTFLLPHSERLHPTDRLAIIIARHLLQRPDFVLIDKLFDNLNIAVIQRWMKLFKRLDVGVVVATNRKDIAALCSQSICIEAQS